MSRHDRHRRNQLQPPHARRLKVEPLEDRRMLAVLTVQNNLDDTLANLAGDGELSLREAIEIANNPGMVIDGFSSADEADEIVFASPVFDEPQTITLVDRELRIRETLTITGPSAQTLVIDAQERSRAIDYFAFDGDLSLSGMTLQNGNASSEEGGAVRFNSSGAFGLADSIIRDSEASGEGGAIFSNGSATIERSHLYRNQGRRSGAGIHANGDLVIADSVIAYNFLSFGGRFSALGAAAGASGGANVTIRRSLISQNASRDYAAGGVSAEGSLTIEDSSVINNVSQGISPQPVSGGITALGDLFLRNSTVSGNRSSYKGGGITAYGNVTLENSTVAHNRTSFWMNTSTIFLVNPNSSSVVAKNSILASNYNEVFNGNFDPSEIDPAILIEAEYSFIGSSSYTNLTESLTPDENGNLIGGQSFQSWIDPMLGVLASYGGLTKTHSLLPGSPAIDAGDPDFASPPAHDQRGAPFARIADGGVNGTRIDMGAYELQSLADLNLVVDSTSDEVDQDYTVGNLSLREAINLANGNPGQDTITFDDALSGETIALGGRELDIADATTIDASRLAEGLTIDASERSRIFHIIATHEDVDLLGLTLTGGRTFVNNIAHSSQENSDHSGGAIRAITAGTVTVADSKLFGNQALNANGGAIFASEGELVILRSEILDNSAPGASGGGVYTGITEKLHNSAPTPTADLVVVDSTISGNHARLDGGGLFTRGFLQVHGSTISENHSYGARGGAGIYAKSDAIIEHSTITNNHASHESESLGAAGLVAKAILSVSNSIIAGNVSSGEINDLQATLPLVQYSLIGDTSGTEIDERTGVGNLLNVDPRLGPIADNGGPTQTHALLPGSPAIDAGDPEFAFDPNAFDQRGAPFLRIADGNLPNDIAIDIGAYEAQSVASADFDFDGDVDGSDFLTWQRGYGIETATRADGNSDDDSDVDASDLAAWTLTYGQGTVLGAISEGAGARGGESLGAERLAAVAAWDWLSGRGNVETSAVDEQADWEFGQATREELDGRAPLAATRRAEYREVESAINEPRADSESWLSEELLERVFG